MIGIVAALLGTLLLLGGKKTPPVSERVDVPPVPPPPLRWSTEGYTAELTPWGDGWRWRVWYTYADLGATLAEGWAPDTNQGRAAAQAWIDDALQVGGTELASQIRRGLRVSNECDAVTVVRVDEWIGWAAPRMPPPEASVDPGAFLLGLFSELFPECVLEEPTIRGIPWDRATAQFAGALERAAAGDLLDVASPEEVLAARAVGLSAPKRQGKAEWYEQHGARWALVVDPHPTGSGWRWRVWMGRREGDPQVERSSPSRDAAMSAARQWVDGRSRVR